MASSLPPVDYNKPKYNVQQQNTAFQNYLSAAAAGLLPPPPPPSASSHQVPPPPVSFQDFQPFQLACLPHQFPRVLDHVPQYPPAASLLSPPENRVVDYNLAPYFAAIAALGANSSSKAIQEQAAKVRAGVTPPLPQPVMRPLAQFPSMDMPYLPVSKHAN